MLQFRRITTQKRFIPQIDGLRFVAIASVVFFHIFAALDRGALPEPIVSNADLAKRGVELFFAISGFILGVPFASHFQSAMILLAVMLFCGAFFLLIERPCMDREWPAKLWRKFRGPLSPGPSRAPVLDESSSVDVPL